MRSLKQWAEPLGVSVENAGAFGLGAQSGATRKLAVRFSLLLGLALSSGACGPNAPPIEDVPDLLPKAQAAPSAPAKAAQGNAAGKLAEQRAEASAQAAFEARLARLAKCELSLEAGLDACDAWAQEADPETSQLTQAARAELLVGSLERPEASVRYAAAIWLERHFKDGSLSKEQTLRVLEVVEKEQSPALAKALAELVVCLELEEAGKQEQVLGWLSAHPNLEFRRELIRNAGFLPGGGEKLAALFDAGDEPTQLAVIQGAERVADQVICPLYERGLKSKTISVSDLAGLKLAQSERCMSSRGSLLHWLQMQTPRHAESTAGQAAEQLCKQGKLDRIERIRVLNIAKRLARSPLAAPIRAEALKAVALCEPETHAFFTRGFLKDSDSVVRATAEQLLATE